MVSQTTGHPNIAGQFMIPLILWAVFRMREPGGTVRKGLVLAGLVVYQCFINEEVLFLAAFALLVFLLVFLRPSEMLPAARAALPALGVTALVAGVVMAYPLWHQFAGPQAYHGLPDFVHGFSADFASFSSFSRRSILGDVTQIEKLGGPTEENTFFGWPLLLLLPAAAVALWRHRGRAGAVRHRRRVRAAVARPGRAVQGRGDHLARPVAVPGRPAAVRLRGADPGRARRTPLVGVLLAILVDRFIMAAPVPRAVAAPRRGGPVSGRPARPRARSPLSRPPTGTWTWDRDLDRDRDRDDDDDRCPSRAAGCGRRRSRWRCCR